MEYSAWSESPIELHYSWFTETDTIDLYNNVLIRIEEEKSIRKVDERGVVEIRIEEEKSIRKVDYKEVV